MYVCMSIEMAEGGMVEFCPRGYIHISRTGLVFHAENDM